MDEDFNKFCETIYDKNKERTIVFEKPPIDQLFSKLCQIENDELVIFENALSKRYRPTNIEHIFSEDREGLQYLNGLLRKEVEKAIQFNLRIHLVKSIITRINEICERLRKKEPPEEV